MGRTLTKWLRSWWRDEQARNVPLRGKCERVVSHVWETGLKGHLNWSWSQEYVKSLNMWESRIVRLASTNELVGRLGVRAKEDLADDEGT